MKRISMRNRVRQLNALARERRGSRSDSEVLEVAQLLWSQLDTPLSLGLSLLAKNRQFEDLLKIDFDSRRYLESDWRTACDDYQAVSFLRKCPLEIEGVDREASAFKKFLDAEEQCRMTNHRFRNLQLERISTRSARVLSRTVSKIAEILGPRVDAKSWALRCRFGPGSDFLHKGRSASAYHKLSEQSVTAGFHDMAQALVQDHPVWIRTLVRTSDYVIGDEESSEAPEHYEVRWIKAPLVIVPGNKVMFVPKTALIDRSIAVEPGMNIYAQLGLGALIRQRLKVFGLNLDEADPNRGLALIGSRDGTIATIDLSMASDTLARELVRFLLPDHWYFCLNACRSIRGQYQNDKETYHFDYEKFSSMGNGFTFELESMIFYAITLACTEELREDTSVVRAFGDDITCPTRVVPLLEEILTFCGFKQNVQKSFSSGVFRESCGMDFFNGRNIRPYFLKESRLNDVQSLYRLANGLRRVAYRRNHYFGCDSKLRRVWSCIVNRIPRPLRNICIPTEFVKFTDPRLQMFSEIGVRKGTDIEDQTGGLISNWDEACRSEWVIPHRDYQRGWRFASFVEQGRFITAEDWPVLLAYALYSCRDGISSDSTTLDRIAVRGHGAYNLTTGRYSPVWQDLGPWF